MHSIPLNYMVLRYRDNFSIYVSQCGGYQSYFIYWRSLVRTTARKPTSLLEEFMVISSRQMLIPLNRPRPLYCTSHDRTYTVGKAYQWSSLISYC